MLQLIILVAKSFISSYVSMIGRHRYQHKLWESVLFKHPSTFDTLAMNPELKAEIKEDLLDFTKGEEFYRRAGKAWKRGYLLYGPPGTGKSSMIAAIANFLQYDIYDVELTEVASNSELRKLLIQTTDQSVIVIEDIDCSLDLSERAKARNKKEAKEKKPDADFKRPGREDEVKIRTFLCVFLCWFCVYFLFLQLYSFSISHFMMPFFAHCSCSVFRVCVRVYFLRELTSNSFQITCKKV
jgi:hypothetical protein